MTADPAKVLAYWFGELGEKGWYVANPQVDETIRQRFGDLPDRALAGDLDAWLDTAPGALALVITLDQFPRNLYRGEARAFDYDAKALGVAESAIERGHDLATQRPDRQFFYMPFEHAEDLEHQERAVALFEERMPGSPNGHFHVKAHRDVIRRFGRFPFRNAALGRENTPQEEEYLAGDGYQPGKGAAKASEGDR